MARLDGRRVVILGAGFGGLNAAIALARLRGRERADSIKLIDRHNYHLFTPILYQVATGLVEPGHIAYPVRVVGERHGFSFQESTVEEIDLERCQVITDDGPIPYDRLVIALGSTTNFFEIEGARERCLTLKTLGDAIQIRNRLVDAFERVDVERDPVQRQKWLTFVVVGGGATGVELMGSMTTLIREAVLPTYPSIRPEEVRLVLVEALPRILRELDPALAHSATQELQRRGVELRLGTMVTGINDDGVTTKSGEFIPTGTVVWAAGVRAAPAAERLPVERARGGRIVVNQNLELLDWPGVYCLGDMAQFTDPRTGEVVPPNAQAAVRQGKYVARVLAAAAEGSRLKPFRYRPVGEIVALGRGAAVAQIKGLKFDGFPAWLVWRSYYLSQLMGFKNQLGVLLDWTHAYLGRREISRVDVATELIEETEPTHAEPPAEPARRSA